MFDLLKKIFGSNQNPAQENQNQRSNGIPLGTATKRLVFVKSLKLAETYPRIRLVPSAKWRFRPCSSPFLLDVLNEVNPHINISGSSGYGKSTLCKTLLTGIAGNLHMPVAVLDVHNEFPDYVRRLGGSVHSPRAVSLNVWELEGLSPAERIGENAEMFRRILDLGEIQAYNLLKCAESAYRAKGIFQEDEGTWGRTPPDMRDVANQIGLLLNSERNARNQSLIGLSKRLYSVFTCNAFSGGTTIPFSDVVSHPTDFTLGDLRSSEAQAMFIETFLRKLYSYMLGQQLVRGVRLYILIDEAHKVCISNSKGMSLPGRLVAEGRKYGIGIITSNQLAKGLDRSIVGNSAMTFAFHQKEPEEEAYVSNLLAGGSENSRREAVRTELRNLRQFEALVITSGIRNPVKIRIAPIWEKGEHGTREEVRAGNTNDDAAVCNEARKPDLPSLVMGRLEAKAWRLSELAAEVRAPESELEAVLAKLAAEGRAEMENVGMGGKTERWVGKRRADRSLQHSACVQMLAEILQVRGIPRSVHDCMDMPDLVAESGGQRVAIEYESGRKKDDAKIREMLVRRKGEFPRVIVVVQEKSLERYARICSPLGVELLGAGEAGSLLEGRC